ncbi:thiamine biosynthesis protein ThiS [Bacteroidia bacterium]|nr:thiamine biosynthesis protein ThiS [Bacteroidia bacterium]GHV20169.1 thiamine biosynthesis protein ThiS [Bacteroidia bacterium]
MAKIVVNDEEQKINLPLSLSELIQLNNILQPDMMSVQINGEFINRENFDDTSINDGDIVDFLYFMGGGSAR